MLTPYLRRIFGLVGLFWFLLLVLKTRIVFGDKSIQRHHAMKTQDPLRVPVKHPFMNKSRHDSIDINKDQASNGVSTPLDSSIAETPVVRTTFPAALLDLTSCPRAPNRFTNHIRLPNLLYNISMIPKSVTLPEENLFWNPTILALPYWSKNQYLIVSMVAPNGEAYRRNVLCEANICVRKSDTPSTSREKYCSEDDIALLGSNGGLRCVTAPIEVNAPPTPAAKCEGYEQVFADIPGFHDPRMFYSGRGEPILMVVSQSQYACIGLWVIDIRAVYPSVEETMSSAPKHLGPGPLMSYPTLTELTRNPPSARQSYEKNWVVFSPSSTSSYLQYEISSSSRTIAKLIGAGLTTSNITDPTEEICLYDPTLKEIENGHYYTENSTWHQATPALKLILCSRSNTICDSTTTDTVFFAAIHRKHVNFWGLPIRYERFMVVWSGTSPFNMLAISQHPILMANETTSGWTSEETWDEVPEARAEGRGFWGRFTYTTTIAYAWGREEGKMSEKGVGYLDDEVILSVGVDDEGQVYGRVSISELLQCLRVCPGRL